MVRTCNYSGAIFFHSFWGIVVTCCVVLLVYILAAFILIKLDLRDFLAVGGLACTCIFSVAAVLVNLRNAFLTADWDRFKKMDDAYTAFISDNSVLALTGRVAEQGDLLSCQLLRQAESATRRFLICYRKFRDMPGSNPHDLPLWAIRERVDQLQAFMTCSATGPMPEAWMCGQEVLKEVLVELGQLLQADTDR